MRNGILARALRRVSRAAYRASDIAGTVVACVRAGFSLVGSAAMEASRGGTKEHPDRLFHENRVYPSDATGEFVELEGVVQSVGDLGAVDVQVEGRGIFRGYWGLLQRMPRLGYTARIRVYRCGGGCYPDNTIMGWIRTPTTIPRPAVGQVRRGTTHRTMNDGHVKRYRAGADKAWWVEWPNGNALDKGDWYDAASVMMIWPEVVKSTPA